METATVGIGGYARAGKSTVAGLLEKHFGFTLLGFADPMRRMAAAIDPVVAYVPDDEATEYELRPMRYNEAVEMFGYDEAKRLFPEIRQFLQRLGTEGGRGVLGESVWIDPAMDEAAKHERVAFFDMRFRNEAEAIHRNKGLTMHVRRPGVEAPNDHPSEHDLDTWNYDLKINNNSTPEAMVTVLEQFFARKRPSILRIA